MIKLSGETDAHRLRRPGTGARGEHDADRIVGNTVTIKPHNNKLAYGTEYYVAIADGVFTNTTSGRHASFVGIGKAAGWSFTTSLRRRRPAR